MIAVMPRYSEERKAAVLKKLLPPQNRSVVQVAAEEGISDVKKAAAILSDPTMTKAEVAEHFRVNKTTLNTSMKREGYSI